MSKALVSFQRPYLGVASFALRNSTGLSPLTNSSAALDLFVANREMARVLGSPRSLEPSVVLPRRQMLQMNTQSPASGAVVPAQTVVEAKTTQAVKKTLDTQPQKSLWQTVTQPKVLIVAGTVAAVAGAAAACYFFPVATAAHAATIGNTGRTVAMNTHQLFIQPGFANALLLADLALQAAVIPAAKFSLPVLLPVISTAIVTTLGTLVLLYLANQVWKVAKVALWGAGTAVVNRFSHECDQTYVGMLIKAVFMKSLFPCGLPSMFANPSASEPQAEADSTEPAAVVVQKDEAVIVRPAPLQITGFVADPMVQEITREEAQAIEAGRATRNKRGQKAQAAAHAKKAQMKAQSTWMGSFIKAGLVTAAAGASVYVYAKAKPDFDYISTEL